MFANLKRLENLDLPGCSLTIQNLQALKHLGQLKKIDLSSIEHLNIFLDQITMLRNWLMENKSKQLDHLEIHTVHYRNCSNAEILVDIDYIDDDFFNLDDDDFDTLDSVMSYESDIDDSEDFWFDEEFDDFQYFSHNFELIILSEIFSFFRLLQS
ncbi:hypothetical protein ACLKA7_006597 [Drosophila subpalustris]